MMEAGTNTDVSREIVKLEGSKQALNCRLRGKRKRRKNKYSLINSSNCRYDLVRFTATKFSIKESLENWNIYWTDLSISVQRCKEMKRFQRINHFPGMMEICRKDLLARNLNRLYKAFPDEYNVFPKTWCLPTDMTEVTEYAKTHKGKCFIVKPDQGCQGRGIAITKNINQLKTYDRMICQQYIQRPFLIDGYKFDLRIYVLITSCDPMRLFVYNEGLARFATAKYKEPNILNASNMYMHLTNYSVNKHSRTYIVDDIDGSKRKLSTINQWFQKNNYDVKKIWDSIDDVIIKTMIVSLPTLKHYYHTCFPNHSTSHACFEILGFDFMFDYRLKPYVLEVNHSPSFNTETTIDHEVKESLLYDTFSILNLQHNNRFRVLIEDKKRARDRLFSVTHSPEILSREKAHEDRISQHRIEWENTHAGNYRKIYPGSNDKYYEKFIAARQNTMYAETVSSKAKEAVPKVGEQAGPSRARIKKLKIGGHEVSLTLKPKEGSGDGQTKEESKSVADDKPQSVAFDSEETSKLEKTPEKPRSPVSSANRGKQTVLPAVPGRIDEVEERERVLNMKKREFLIKSHGILEKVYENLKNAGLLKLESDIKIGRSNKWEDDDEVSKSYTDGYQKFNTSMVQVLDCISKKVEIRLPDPKGEAVQNAREHQKSNNGSEVRPEVSHIGTDPLPVDALEDFSYKDEKVQYGDSMKESLQDRPRTHVSGLQDQLSRKLTVDHPRLPVKDVLVGIESRPNTAYPNCHLIYDRRTGTGKPQVSVEVQNNLRRQELRASDKTGIVSADDGLRIGRSSGHQKSHSMYDRRRFEVFNAGTTAPGFLRKLEKPKSGDLLPNSLLKIERPYVGSHKPHSLLNGRRFEVTDDLTRKAGPVEVVTPYVLHSREHKPATVLGSQEPQVLKIGHFGKQEAWGSLEEYFEQRKILNRSWQNTDV